MAQYNWSGRCTCAVASNIQLPISRDLLGTWKNPGIVFGRTPWIFFGHSSSCGKLPTLVWRLRHTSVAESTAAHCAEKDVAAVRAKRPQRHSCAGVFKAALYAESCCRLSYSSTRIYLRPLSQHSELQYFPPVSAALTAGNFPQLVLRPKSIHGFFRV